jgi:hypothetical protein
MSEERIGEEDLKGTKEQLRSHCICCETSYAMRRLFRSIRPSEQVSGHFRQSRIEFLKGIRSLVDERIEHLGRTPHKGARVVVE